MDSVFKVSCKWHFFVSVVLVLFLCFVKYKLSLSIGLCATTILKGRSSLRSFQMCRLCKVELLSSLTVQVVRWNC